MAETTQEPGTQYAIRQGCICPETKRQPAPSKTRTQRDWMCVCPFCPVHGWRDDYSNFGRGKGGER